MAILRNYKRIDDKTVAFLNLRRGKEVLSLVRGFSEVSLIVGEQWEEINRHGATLDAFQSANNVWLM